MKAKSSRSVVDGELQNPDGIDIQRTFINVMDEYVGHDVLQKRTVTNVFRGENKYKAENMNERQPTEIIIISISSITYLTIPYIVYEVLGKAICSRTSISTQLAEYEGIPSTSFVYNNPLFRKLKWNSKLRNLVIDSFSFSDFEF